MKTVFTNSMCAHVWAQQTQEYGKSNHRNISFQGTKLYSYTTEIANFVTDKDGRRVMLLTERNFSLKSYASSAVQGLCNYYEVPFIDEGWYKSNTITWSEVHAANATYLTKQYTDMLAKMKRARNLWYDPKSSLQNVWETQNNYRNRFNVVSADINVEADYEELMKFCAEREARLNTPERIAKREKEKERRAKRTRDDFIQCRGIFGPNFHSTYSARNRFTEDDFAARAANLAIINADKIASWRAGFTVSMYDISAQTMLRIRGDNIESSKGASFPVEHGKKAFPLIKKCHDEHREFKPNGHSIYLGHFTITEVTENGDVRAGCHFVKWNEIEQIAKQLELI